MSTEHVNRPPTSSGMTPPPSSGTTTSPGSTAAGMAEQAKQQGQQLADQAKEQGQQLADQAKQQGQQVADTISQTTGQGVEKAASAAEGLAGTIREKAPSLPGDKTTDIAYQAADTLERGAEYVRDADVDRMRGDFEDMIRKYPVQSIAVGLAAGFLLARMFR